MEFYGTMLYLSIIQVDFFVYHATSEYLNISGPEIYPIPRI